MDVAYGVRFLDSGGFGSLHRHLMISDALMFIPTPIPSLERRARIQWVLV